jgi:hypothetical protein
MTVHAKASTPSLDMAPAEEAPSKRPLWQLASVIAIATLGVLLLGTHSMVILDRIDRALDHDESQHLHIAWLMAQGLRPFVDFDEHHAPFLHLLLERLIPTVTNARFPLLDVPTFAARARILCAAAGTTGVLAASVLTLRATGRAITPLLTAALLLGARFFWLRGVADVRTDPLALMLFWGGALLVTLEGSTWVRAGAAKGLGAGLACVAFLVNPKWPLMTAVLCLWALVDLVRRSHRAVRALAVGLAVLAGVLACALGLIAWDVGLRRYAFNVLAFSALSRGNFSPLGVNDELSVPFHYCAPVFHPWVLVPVLSLGAALAYRHRRHWRVDPRARIGALIVLLLCASAAELRLLYPYPRLWHQYFLAWSVCSACVYALVAEVVRDAIARSPVEIVRRAAPSVHVACCVVAFGLYGQFVARPDRHLAEDLARWSWISTIQNGLSPGDRVWVRGDVHPIAALDASYYWVGFLDLVPISLAYAEEHADQHILPRMTDADLPPCRVLAGDEDDVRFFSMVGPDYRNLPKTAACLQRLVRDGRLCATPFPVLARVPHAGTDCAGAPVRP